VKVPLKILRRYHIFASKSITKVPMQYNALLLLVTKQGCYRMPARYFKSSKLKLTFFLWPSSSIDTWI